MTKRYNEAVLPKNLQAKADNTRAVAEYNDTVRHSAQMFLLLRWSNKPSKVCSNAFFRHSELQ